MSGTSEILFYSAMACVVGCVAILTYLAAIPNTTEVSDRGERGYQRQLARRNTSLGVIEPALRLVAAWVALLPLGTIRTDIDDLIRQAGNFLGLTADEFVAMCILSGILGFFLCSQTFPEPMPMIVISSAFALLPYVKVSGVRSSRAVEVTRALPASIELIALCVSAGMDFPGAIRELIGDDAGEDDTLNSEYRQLLRDLDLGHSRKAALNAFSERTKGDGVSDFVAALIQSEEKGNPLKGVLAAQATVLHTRRSFRAEEMATQAGVKMVIPLAMLMLMVLAIIITPLILKMKEQGF